MAGPIYKVFMGRILAPWYELSKEEQDALFGQLNAAMKESGGKSIVNCNASTFSDEWQLCGVEEFPDLDAVQKYAAALMKLEWFRYVESKSVLGMTWQDDTQAPE